MSRGNSNYRSFVILVARFVGFVFAIGGAILTIWTIATVVNVPDKLDSMDAIIGGVLSAVISVLGVLMLIAKPPQTKGEMEKK